MRTIIAGSRTITDPTELETAIKNSGFQISLVISGGAQGVDTLGENWAKVNNVPIKQFLPDWQTYGKAAGVIRNTQMIEDVGIDGALLIIWDGKSRGTQDTIRKASKKGLLTYIHIVKMKINETDLPNSK